MRKIKEVLRLKFETDLSNQRIACCYHISRPAVTAFLIRFEEAGLSWPAAAGLDDDTLEQKLYPPAPTLPGKGSARSAARSGFSADYAELERW